MQTIEKPTVVEAVVVVEKKQEILPEPAVVAKQIVEEIKPVIVVEAAAPPAPVEVKPEAKVQRSKAQQKQVDNIDSSLKKPTIVSTSQLENKSLNDLTESLIRDAVETKVEDEWIPSKSSKKVKKNLFKIKTKNFGKILECKS